MTFSHSKSYDKWIESLGVGADTLMEIAAYGVFKELEGEFEPRDLDVVVVAGKGNNGGDGVALARILATSGANVRVYVPENGHSPLLQKQLKIFRELELGSVRVYDTGRLKVDVASSDLVIDALFGVGFKGPMKPPFSDVADVVNEYAPFVLSVDVPSGVDENGQADEHAVKADMTVCLGGMKTSVLLYPGRVFAGDVRVVEFGFPFPDDLFPYYMYELQDIKEMLPRRLGNEHKGSFGRVAIFAGSFQYPGTAYLTSLGALRSGVGLIYTVVPKSLKHVVNSPSPLPDVIMVEVPDKRGTFVKENVEYVVNIKLPFNSIVVGPGITRSPSAMEFVNTLLRTFPHVPTVVDADALFVFKNKPFPDNPNLVLTPHPGELGAITGKSPATVDRERVEIAKRLSRTFPGVLVLKGAPTVIAHNGEVVINPTGSTALSRGGSGDLLSGLIGGFLAQGVKPFEAAVLAVYLHGLAADLLPSERSFRVVEIADALRDVFALVENPV